MSETGLDKSPESDQPLDEEELRSLGDQIVTQYEDLVEMKAQLADLIEQKARLEDRVGPDEREATGP
jgi:hypothetical protein